MLISSGVSRYLEFKNLDNIFMFSDNQFQLVNRFKFHIRKLPCTKGHLFSSSYLSLLEKRMLSKFIGIFRTQIEEEMKGTSSKAEQTSDQSQEDAIKETENNKAEMEKLSTSGSFLEFLKKVPLNARLEKFVMYSLCFYDSNGI